MGKPKFHPWNEDGNGKIRLDLNNWMASNWETDMQEYQRMFHEHQLYSNALLEAAYNLTDPERLIARKKIIGIQFSRQHKQISIGRDHEFLYNWQIDRIENLNERDSLIESAKCQMKLESDYEQKLEKVLQESGQSPTQIKKHYLPRLLFGFRE